MSCPILLYKPVRTLGLSPARHEVPGTCILYWCWQPGFLMNQIFYGDIRPYRGELINVGVSMMIIRVLTMKMLCQVMMGRVLVLGCLLPSTRGCMWCEALNSTASTRLHWLYLVLKRPPGITTAGLGACWAGLQGATVDGQVAKFCSSAVTEMGEVWYRLGPSLVLFRLVVHPLQP
jgi:hypothetical protein